MLKGANHNAGTGVRPPSCSSSLSVPATSLSDQTLTLPGVAELSVRIKQGRHLCDATVLRVVFARVYIDEGADREPMQVARVAFLWLFVFTGFITVSFPLVFGAGGGPPSGSITAFFFWERHRCIAGYLASVEVAVEGGRVIGKLPE